MNILLVFLLRKGICIPRKGKKTKMRISIAIQYFKLERQNLGKKRVRKDMLELKRTSEESSISFKLHPPAKSRYPDSYRSLCRLVLPAVHGKNKA